MQTQNIILKKFIGLVLGTLATISFTAQGYAALYASTAAGGLGELYVINPATGGLAQDVGPLTDGVSVNYAVTGLAFNPITGLLYGSTGNANAATAAKLISINPNTASVTVIGSFAAGNAGNPATMADIAFDSSGNLFGIGSVGGPQLYSINLFTGKATLIGGTGLTSTSGGGLAISSGGLLYGTPTATRFGTYDPNTGAFANIASPNLPVGGAYAALSFDAAGVLYGLDLGPGPALLSHLVTINPNTGAVTDIGQSITSLDAIAFQPVPEPRTVALLLGSGAVAFLTHLRRRK
ncbi:MAG: PEP-CTERM sorting domain-containing protein [Verrucomicrobiota bacterium]